MLCSFKTYTTTALICSLAFLACDKNKPDSDKTGGPGPQQKTIHLSVLLTNLEYPWGLAYLPNGDLLFTERPGRLNLLKKGSGNPVTVTTRQVQQNSEGGLLGVAVDPDFGSNHFIYLYETADANQVVRFTFENEQLSNEKVILGGIPKNYNHDGGALRFGPDGFLYVGTGDAQDPPLSQDRSVPAGKILRIDREGNPASGNPFGTAVWSYGHRNVQGLAWHGNGKLYATEHGPSGDMGWCCHDEANLVVKGGNYGWPLALGGTEKDSLRAPLAHSGETTWAPSGCEFTGELPFWSNTLVVACLRGEKLIRFKTDGTGDGFTGQSDTLAGTYGRIRNVIRTPHNSLIFCTSNGDDQIVEIGLK